MKENAVRGKKFYLGLIILIAASGTIFFFPMNIGGRYTCFYHRLFDPPQSSEAVNSSPMLQDYNSGQEIHYESSHQQSELLHNYLHQYAFIWWGSVGLLALCVYLFIKQKRNQKVNESRLTLK